MPDLVYFRTSSGGAVTWDWMPREQWDAMTDHQQTKHRDALNTAALAAALADGWRSAGNSVVPADEVPVDVRERAKQEVSGHG